MLKKTAIAAGATVVALLGAGGVAYADDAGTHCTATEKTEQHNKGKQLIGGSVFTHDINGFIGGSINKSIFCPSAFNGAKSGANGGSDDDSDD
jgi:hypothetical protein